MEYAKKHSKEPSRYLVKYRKPDTTTFEVIDVLYKANLTAQHEPYFKSGNEAKQMKWTEWRQKRWPKGKPEKKTVGLTVWASQLANTTRLRRQQIFDVSCITHVQKIREENDNSK